jgi:P27 family predicted phage terminase small subunit
MWLHPQAIAEWHRIMVSLGSPDWIKPTDQGALAAYCQMYARWRQAEELLDQEGAVVDEPVLDKDKNATQFVTKKRHPAVLNSKDAVLIMAKLGSEFGFTPSSRTRVQVPQGEEAGEGAQKTNDADDLDALLGVSIN